MTREELIKQCRYYGGEKECPFDSGSLHWYWDMERVYVSCNGKFEGETDYYKRIGVKIILAFPFLSLWLCLHLGENIRTIFNNRCPVSTI